MSESARPAPEIRLQVLDDSTPHTTFVEIFKLFGAAFGSDSPIWAHMYPPPRPPMDEMADAGAQQHKLDCGNPELVGRCGVGQAGVSVELVGSGEDERGGKVCVPGVQFGVPECVEANIAGSSGQVDGFRAVLVSPVPRQKTRPDARKGTYPSSPSTQTCRKYKVGSKLLDQGIAWADEEKRATLLESSVAGKRLYESRGFVKEEEFPVCARSIKGWKS
ncbi:hypothetical protein QFC20_001366 [Naganishia adeliensis]|uniref:Uncharacterized protein n=1 Tax=Naganishia adeliensis TaxID=92952 RepID=A0ACC2WSP8_9TREE|nr:hypothetical protein QFC20_001366 [Naganishia adeliensis]